MPTLRETLIATLLRRYPLMSGSGTLANHRMVKALSGVRQAREWARCHNSALLCPLHEYVGRAAFFCGDLDPKVSHALRRVTRPGDVALDIGGNIGLMAVLLANAVGRDGRVVTFEPNPNYAELLATVIERNAYPWLSHAAVALGPENGTAELAFLPDRPDMGTLAEAATGAKRSVSVPLRRLDDVVAELGVDRVDVAKLDVEGFEAQVLSGSERVFAEMRPRAVLFEAWDAETGGIDTPAARFFRERGYRLLGIPKTLLRLHIVPLDAAAPIPADIGHDLIAVPEEKTGEVFPLLGVRA